MIKEEELKEINNEEVINNNEDDNEDGRNRRVGEIRGKIKIDDIEEMKGYKY